MHFSLRNFTLAAMGMALLCSARAQVTNGSFQTGDFNGWETVGITSIVAGAPQAGNQALMRSATGADVVTIVNPFLNVTLPGNSQGAATDASAIRQFINTPVGGRVIFSTSYQTNEGAGSGWDETGYVVNGVFYGAGNTSTPGIAGNGVGGFTNGASYQRTIVSIGAGNNLLGFVAYNTDDNLVSTGLYVADVIFVPYFSQYPNLTPNQRAIASNIDGFVFDNLNSEFTVKLLGNLSGLLMNQGGFVDALNQLSPQKLEALTSVGFNNATFTTQTVNNHLANLRDGGSGIDTAGINSTDSGLAPVLGRVKSHLLAWNPLNNRGEMTDAPSNMFAGTDMKKDAKDMVPRSKKPENRWSAFVNGDVILAETSSTAELTHTDYTTGGVTIGADYRLDDNFVVGGLFNYANTDLNLDNIGSKAKIDGYTPGVYASYVNGSWYANGLATYTHNSYKTSRNIVIGSINGTNEGSPDGDQWMGSVTGGYEFKKGNWKFGPELGLTYTGISIDSFQERGPTSLNVGKQNADSLRTRLGGQARFYGNVDTVKLVPHAGVYWQHEYLDDSRGITASFNQISGGSFTVNTTSPDRDSALLTVGLDAQIWDNIMLFGNYLAQVGQDNFFAQTFQGGVQVGF